MAKSNKNSGRITFEITESNQIKLNALFAYNEMIDMINTGSKDAIGMDHLTKDGVINALLDIVTDDKIRSLVRRHGFASTQDFIDCMSASESPKRTYEIIQNSEKTFYKKQYDWIVSQIPVDDKQMNLFDGKEKQ